MLSLYGPGVKTLENRRRAPRRQREKQAKCDCAAESCSPRFTVIQGITTLFNNSGRTVKGRRGGACSRLRRPMKMTRRKRI